jgi:hypothetical protein
VTINYPAKTATCKGALLLVDHQHRAGATLPHAPAGMLHRLVRGQHKRLLVFDNVRELSVGHDQPSP